MFFLFQKRFKLLLKIIFLVLKIKKVNHNDQILNQIKQIVNLT